MALDIAKVAISATDNTKGAFDSVESSLGKLKGNVIAAGAAAAAVAGGAFAALIKGSIDAADEMGKLAQVAGMSVERFSRFQAMASLGDMDMQSLSKTMGDLYRQMMAADGGNAKAQRTFETLGISVRDANGQMKTADVVLGEVADRFAGMEDGATKSTLATELFKDAGATLIPTLNEGSAALNEMLDLSDRLGLTMSGETAAGAAAVNDSVTIMGLAVKGITNNVMQQMLPTFQNLSSVMIDVATDADLLKAAGDGLSVMLKSLVSAGIVVKSVFSTLGNYIGGVAAAWMAVLSGDFKAAKGILEDMGSNIVDNVSTDMDRIAKLWEDNTPRAAAAAAQTRKTVVSGYAQTESELKKIADERAKEQKRQQDERYKLDMAGLASYAKFLSDESVMQKAALDQRFALGQISARERDAMQREMNDERLRMEEQVLIAELQLAQAQQDRLKEIEVQGRLDRLAAEQEAAAGGLSQYQMQAAGAGKTPLEEEMARYQAEVDLAETYRQLNWANEERYQQMLEEAKDQHETNLTNLALQGHISREQFAKMSGEAQVKTHIGLMQQIIGGASQHSRALFNMQKTAALAEAAVSLPRTVMAAYEAGASIGGPFALVTGAAYAAVAFAAQMAQMRAIKSAQFGGGGGGAAAVGGGTSSIAIPGQKADPGTVGDVPVAAQATQAKAAEPPKQVNITLRGTDVFSAASVRDQLIPVLNDALGDGVQLNVRAA